MVYLISILIYALSAFGMWKFIQIAYSDGGIWNSIAPTRLDVFVTFCPGVNTFGCFSFMITGARKRGPVNYSKFFKIKK